MTGDMKKPLNNKANFEWNERRYSIPLQVMEKYKITYNDTASAFEDVFADLINKRGESSLLLRGLRNKEDLSQIEFAKKIFITQNNLSAMENGRRSIGKDIAKRIAKVFGVDYRIFL